MQPWMTLILTLLRSISQFIHDLLLLQTACADGVVRVFKLDDASSKSFKYECQVP